MGSQNKYFNKVNQRHSYIIQGKELTTYEADGYGDFAYRTLEKFQECFFLKIIQEMLGYI